LLRGIAEGEGFLKLRSWQILIALVVSAGAIASPSRAVAALGGDVSSVQDDQVYMKAALRIQTGQAFTVHELHQESGTVVKEFIAPTGKVFAVSWSGPFIPDLHQLLGSYFDQFSQAAQTRARRPGRAPLAIQQNGLVVQSGGHMRAFFGKAYLTDELPQTVRAEMIR
jgi:Protein of unknown function (DUF2844)